MDNEIAKEVAKALVLGFLLGVMLAILAVLIMVNEDDLVHSSSIVEAGHGEYNQTTGSFQFKEIENGILR